MKTCFNINTEFDEIFYITLSMPFPRYEKLEDEH